ncbi:MAG: apolipoprotein N-acyltransferase, partial [Albidovulum sp.]|uniref:apolipoprotein N-acyltransferase n=1 Tax=Albidovulum sp. TaxID=1872424 RepID=UPI003CA86756
MSFFRRENRPDGLRLALAALLGAVMALGQAPWSLWWLAVPALTFLTLLIAVERRAMQAVWLGWIAGAGYFAASLFWIVEPFFVDAGTYGWMAPFALLFMSFGMALFWALSAGIGALGRGPCPRAVGFAIGLTATDLLRGYIFTGFPWALIGHIWIGTPVAQAAALVGPVGLSALTAFAAALPVLARATPTRIGLAALSVTALGGVWAIGTARLAKPEAPRDPAIQVRLIQPNAAQHLKWRGDMWRIFLDRQMEQTAEPAKEPLDLIVWPETAVPFLLSDSGGFFKALSERSGGVPVVVGIQREEGLRFFNSLAAIDGEARVTAVYDKWHLVPFGEYIPFGDVMARFGITAFAAQQGNGYSPGPGPRILDLGRAGQVLPLICYEAVFPQDLRMKDDRPDWILQITNDSWFGNIAGPYQHLAQAQLRAIEQGLPLLRSANTGVTAVIDAKGRIKNDLALNTQGVLDTAVPPSLAPTLYARTGDIPATILVIAALSGLILVRRRQSD